MSQRARPQAPASAIANLDSLFRARSVCMVGVSGNPAKLNGKPLAILRLAGFTGELLLVNPKYEEIDGLPCWPSVEALPHGTDTALVMVPAREVPEVIRACGRKGMRSAIVLSSGFDEVAGSETLVRDLRAAADESGIALVGPNCEGLWSVRQRVVLTFGSAAAREVLHHAPIAIISQSGAVGGAVARHLQDSGLGCAYLVSVGNESQLEIADYLEYLVEQEDVRLVLLFVEAFKHGERLARAARRAARGGVRIVALKAGNSPLAAAATASHTGKVSSQASIYRDAFEQFGVMQVERLSDLFEICSVLTAAPQPLDLASPQSGAAILSVPGGTRALTVDYCARAGVPLARFEESTVARMRQVLPRFGYPENPCDITGEVLSSPRLLADCLKLAAQDHNTQAVLVQLANRGPIDALDNLQVLRATAEESGKPIVLSFLGDALPADRVTEFARAGIACARDPQDAVRYLSWMLPSGGRPAASVSAPRGTVACPSDSAGWLATLERAGVGLPAWRLLAAADDPIERLAGLRFPVAVKALPEAASHKTELGLLHLGCADPATAAEAGADLRRRLGDPEAVVLVQEMVLPGVELLVCLAEDPDFGPVLTLGSGGVLVEHIGDIGHVILPARRVEVAWRLGRLKVARQLAGLRGAPAADCEALLDLLQRLCNLYLALTPRPREIEFNPVIVGPEGAGAWVVDWLVRQEAGESGAT